MTEPDALLALFADTAGAVASAVAAIPKERLRDRTDRPGQYGLDVVADAAACAVLERAGVRILSEESGLHGPPDAVTVVIDPVDGSTNCARGIAYWATSLCAIDREGALASLVVNQATGQHTAASRGAGATRDGVPLHVSSVTRIEDAVIDFGGFPEPRPQSKQARMLGSIALSLCEVAAGGIDGHVDAGAYMGPWDYLGGMLACIEAGGIVCDGRGEPLVTAEPSARRQIVAAGTRELLETLLGRES